MKLSGAPQPSFGVAGAEWGSRERSSPGPHRHPPHRHPTRTLFMETICYIFLFFILSSELVGEGLEVGEGLLSQAPGRLRSMKRTSNSSREACKSVANTVEVIEDEA